MAKLNLDRQESDFLNNTIAHWEKENLIDAEQAGRLRQSYEVKGFDWMRLAKYSIWVALFCGAIAIGSFIVDDAVINWIKNLYDTPDIVISLLSAVAAVGLFYLGRRREKQHPEQVFTNEATIFLGVFFTACCIAYLGNF
ncbi:MAG: DUF2157 domain-containing protein [Mucilaginibacter sp.]|nr:DUF2157 domain-containing protein [Mucilaginibacter sp.]